MKLLIIDSNTKLEPYEIDKNDTIIKCDRYNIIIIKSKSKIFPVGYKCQQTNENMQQIIAHFI